MIKILTTLLALVILNLPTASFADATKINVEGMDGKQHSLGKYIGQGKWTLVTFWAVRCPICLEEMPELQFFHDDHSEKDANVIGIAIDFPSFGYANRKEVEEYLDNNFITFPIFLGSAETFTEFGQVRLYGTPTTLFYDPKGKLNAIQVGKVTNKEIEAYLAKQKNK